jgi:hypothetical protein
MAETTHYFYLDRIDNGKIKTACGTQDPTDIATNAISAVSCDDCLEEMGKIKMGNYSEPTGGAYGTPDRGMTTPQKEDPAIGAHREGLSGIEKEMDQARRIMTDHRSHLLAEVRVLQAQIELSRDTIARITSFLGDEEAKVIY